MNSFGNEPEISSIQYAVYDSYPPEHEFKFLRDIIEILNPSPSFLPSIKKVFQCETPCNFRIGKNGY